ncbi:MAG TPA: uroporphyrinogen-III C-methyltransferase [Acidimicrobiales bacterium]|nr:uroporphyrinogen-III C-methyltransferase [Acidimicrobiales bacterium]
MGRERGRGAVTVYLVGAGPGDPGLITVRGAELLAAADVVVYDRLAEASLLELAPAGAELVDVGKRPGSPVPQEEINALLVDRARAGHRVVRLKGGDPFVFGRGGEEAVALAAAGVAFEVVPGVTSAVAAPAYAGVPVTHRGLSPAFTVVTGHAGSGPDGTVDWEALARVGGTIVILMGVAQRAEVAERLIAGGLSPRTPVVAVEWGTRPDQRSLRTDLAGLGAAAVEPPAAIVVGAVAGMDLSWFESRPLFGRRVVVTRAAGAASALTRRLLEAGADVLEVPTTDIVDPPDGGAALAEAAGAVGSSDWLVVTSANGAERFMDCLPDARALGGVKVAAVGPGTAAALARRGVVADLVPEGASSGSALAAAFPDPSGGRRVLLARSEQAAQDLPAALAARGWEVHEVAAYATRPAKPEPELLRQATSAWAVTFASAAAVRSYVEAAGPGAVPAVVACIGPVTAAAARQAGLHTRARLVLAGRQSLDGLVEVLVGAAGGTGDRS